MISDSLKIALEGASDSASRCRIVSYALVTASVLAFMAFWNSVSWSWVSERQKALTAAVDGWADPKSPDYQIGKKLVEGRFGLTNYYGSPGQSNLLGDLKLMRIRIDTLRDNEVRWVKIPVFSVGFDVNDLGMFAGIGFSILLVLLAFSQRREFKNVKAYFKLAEEEAIQPLAYRLLAMRQVLTIPPGESERGVPVGWRILQLLPVFVPLLVQLCIVVNDFATLGNGFAWSSSRTNVMIGVNSVSALLVGTLTILCVSYRRNINDYWVKMRAEAFPKREPGE